MKKPRNNNLQKTPLHQILGLHSHTKRLLRQHTGFIPFSTPLLLDITPEVFDTLLYMNPLIIKNISGKLYVVGNIRTYQLLLENVNDNYLVLYKEISNRRITEIEKLFWSEYLIQPILYNRNRSRLKWLYKSWVQFSQNFRELWSPSPFSQVNTKKSFAALLKTDVRTLDK